MTLNKKEMKRLGELLKKYLVHRCQKCKKKIDLMYEYAVSNFEDKEFKTYCKKCYKKAENIVVWHGRIGRLSLSYKPHQKYLKALLKEKNWNRQKALKLV